MSYVLAIEPHEPQADILRGDIGATARTKVKVVTTVAAAMAAIDNEVPKIVLLNALMRPSEESQLIDRLRRLPHAIAPQVLITPMLSAFQPPAAPSSKLRIFERFRKTGGPFRPEPCDPAVFAGQLCEYLGNPDRVGADRRAAKRIEDIAWARLVLNGATADLIDLSLVGAQVRSPIVLPQGESVRLLLSRESETEVLQCEAAVVWGVSDEAAAAHAARYRAGIRFTNVDHQLLDRLCFGSRGMASRPDNR
jgi:hypothetical protein